MRSIWCIPALAAVVAVGLTGCDDADTPEFEYSSQRVAPTVADYPDHNTDETPDPDGAVAELALDDGATLVLWVDPDDIRKVFQQHSDPDDPEAWTEPELLHEAGDGCLYIDAATNGEVVAAVLGCYADDAFIQQAPDATQTVVTRDLDDWKVVERGEFLHRPEVSDDGDVDWVQEWPTS